MFAFVYVFTCVCLIHTYDVTTCTSICLALRCCMYLYSHVCVYIYLHIYTHIYIYIYTYICIYHYSNIYVYIHI